MAPQPSKMVVAPKRTEQTEPLRTCDDTGMGLEPWNGTALTRDDEITVHVAGAPKRRGRTGRRYPFEANVVYRVRVSMRERAVVNGRGRTVNLSSDSVVIVTPSTLPTDAEIELFIAWPVKLNQEVDLNLNLRGRTVSCDANCTVITFRRYEFRTRAA
jgi:hypothetical protein